MEEITIKQLEEKAQELQNAEKRWHFHMLTPDCLFNESNDKHALVIEDTTDDQQYVAYSKNREFALGKKLLKLLHGGKVLTKSKKPSTIENPNLQKLIDRAKDINKKGLPWHHHVLFPDCQYNDRVGQWNIVMEDKEKGELLEASYDLEPTNDQNIIEQLFYDQKE